LVFVWGVQIIDQNHGAEKITVISREGEGIHLGGNMEMLEGSGIDPLASSSAIFFIPSAVCNQ